MFVPGKDILEEHFTLRAGEASLHFVNRIVSLIRGGRPFYPGLTDAGWEQWFHDVDDDATVEYVFDQPVCLTVFFAYQEI